mgnify:FL=1
MLFSFHPTDFLIFIFAQEVQLPEKIFIFLTSPTVFMMRRIAKIIKNNKYNKDDKSYYVICSPRRTFLAREALEREGVFADINLIDFNFDLIPIEDDLLSMQMDKIPKDLYLDLDTSSLIYVAESIQRLQLVFGRIPHIIGKGYSAKVGFFSLCNWAAIMLL